MQTTIAQKHFVFIAFKFADAGAKERFKHWANANIKVVGKVFYTLEDADKIQQWVVDDNKLEGVGECPNAGRVLNADTVVEYSQHTHSESNWEVELLGWVCPICDNAYEDNVVHGFFDCPKCNVRFTNRKEI